MNKILPVVGAAMLVENFRLRFKHILVLCAAVLLSGCAGKSSAQQEYEQDARAALERLDAIRHKVEAGINYDRFSDELSDAAPVLGSFTEKYAPQEGAEDPPGYLYITMAWGALQTAREHWHQSIFTDYDYTRSRDAEIDLAVSAIEGARITLD